MLKTLFERRSIRKYKADPVKEEDLRTILRAGCYAPSAMNRQPWHFVVVDDRTTLDSIPEMHRYASMMRTAPMAIIVCGDLNVSEVQWQADCAAVTQNILLAAHELGYGTCWCGVAPHEDVMQRFADKFGIPDHVRPYSLIALGVPDEERTVPERYEETRVHRNRW